jgi:hypothetical protein
MNEYRIEKLRCPVTVVMAGGERISGDLFVQSMVPFRLGPEEPFDVFNGPDPFVPIAMADGEILIVAKTRVAEVEVGEPSQLEEERLTGLRPTGIELTLAGLEPRTGFLHIAVRNERPRLLDYLNSLGQQFLALYTASGVRLINRALIERVRPLD